MSTPNALKAFIVLIVSSAMRRFLIILFPFDRDEKITALWDMDLSGVGENLPLKLLALMISILSNTFPQCLGLFKIPFEGFRIICPEILTCPVEIVFKNLNRFKEIFLIKDTYIAP